MEKQPNHYMSAHAYIYSLFLAGVRPPSLYSISKNRHIPLSTKKKRYHSIPNPKHKD